MILEKTCYDHCLMLKSGLKMQDDVSTTWERIPGCSKRVEE